jgi:hypothetical protein
MSYRKCNFQNYIYLLCIKNRGEIFFSNKTFSDKTKRNKLSEEGFLLLSMNNCMWTLSHKGHTIEKITFLIHFTFLGNKAKIFITFSIDSQHVGT